VKSPTELKYMRRAGIIVENIYERVLDVFEVGMRKNDVVAEILHTGISGGVDEDGISFGGDYSAIAPLVPTGIEATAAHLTWSRRPVPNNSGTFFEIAGVHRRYHVPTCRTIWLGDPPKNVRHVEDVTLEAMEAGMAKARIGNTAGDVATAFYDVLRKRGLPREGRCGYPIGLSYPPDWGERSFSIREGDPWVFQENETFHFMPAMWMDDWGLEITETLQITKGPAKPLANIERKLFVKP
jgi:ectoine hydrolase